MRPRTTGLARLAVLGALALAGCRSAPAGPVPDPLAAGSRGAVTELEVQALVMQLADDYDAALGETTYLVLREELDSTAADRGAQVALHLLLPLRQWLVHPWRLAGLVPLGTGIGLNLVADRAFKLHGTTVKPIETSSSLVTTGVFSISRNPMYLGMALILLGLALLLGSVTPFAVAIALPVLLDRRFIVPEERMLEATFGEEFRRYRSRVRRWV